MTEQLNCAFLPPNFTLNDVSSVAMYYENPPETSHSVQLEVDSRRFDLGDGVPSGNLLSWSLDEAGDFQELTPGCKEFSIIDPNGTSTHFDLTQLLFLGPTKNSSPPSGIYLLEFTSGFFCRNEDFTGDSVTFNIDSILTLDYRNVQAIRQQLDELAQATKTFEETKQHLADSGIKLSELEQLKEQYETCMRDKRRIQHEFLQETQRMQAATLHSRAQSERDSAIQSLHRHIAQNSSQPPPQEPTLAEQRRLVRFRLSALDELKMIFPFSKENRTLCGVAYTDSPINSQQWNETRSFLGFATHYIREVARIVGIPLQFLLVPRASVSIIVCRLTDEKRQIPVEGSPKENITLYEQSLVACVQHIAKTLMMELPGNSSIIEYLDLILNINEEALNTLIPEGTQ